MTWQYINQGPGVKHNFGFPFIFFSRKMWHFFTGMDKEDKETSTPHLYKLQTLRIATNYFSPLNKLGEGGFGSVYKVNERSLIYGLFVSKNSIS
jgi:hypothetical protein